MIQPFLSELKQSFSKISRTYIISLIITRNTKNCSEMSRQTGITSKTYYSYLRSDQEEIESIITFLKTSAQELCANSKPKDVHFTIDDTSIPKPFASKIEGLCYGWNGVLKRVAKGLSIIVTSVSNGKITIPIDFKYWVQKKYTHNYKKKSDLAKELIKKAINNFNYQKVVIDSALLDGLYGSADMLKFFDDHSCQCFIRIACNRKVETADGEKAQLRHHSKLKLKKNQRYAVIEASYKGRNYYFYAFKRKKKKINEYEKIFIVT